MTKVTAIIQAREGSSRLPSKVILPLGTSTSLKKCYDACLSLDTLTSVIVATGSADKNPGLIKYCKQHSIFYQTGSDNDVLSRYVNIANETSPDLIIRITADCPLIRPHLLSECISYVIENELDYCSLSPDFAEGVDVEVLTASALDKIQTIASNAFDREHVTYALHKNQSNFKVGQVQNKMDHSHIRLTLDHPEDYKLLQEIFQKHEQALMKLNYLEMIQFLEKKCKTVLYNNSHILRNEVLYE